MDRRLPHPEKISSSRNNTCVLAVFFVDLAGLVLLARILDLLDLQAGDDGLVFGLLAVVPLDEAGPEKLGEEVVHVHVGGLRRPRGGLRRGVLCLGRLRDRVVPGLDLVALVVGLGGRLVVLLVGVGAAARGEQREELVKAGGLVFAALVAALRVAVLAVKRGRRARLLTRI